MVVMMIAMIMIGWYNIMMMSKHISEYICQLADWSINDADEDDGIFPEEMAKT